MVESNPNHYHLPLLPRHQVDLFVWWQKHPVDQGQAHRFVRLFREVWGALPLGVRRRLLAYWRQVVVSGSEDAPRDRAIFPAVQLCDDKSDFHRGSSGSIPFGQTALLGLSFSFWSRACAILPDEWVRHLIAHELAHGLAYVTGEMVVPDDGSPPSALECELDADSRAGWWGFEEPEIPEDVEVRIEEMAAEQMTAA